jgi:membrane protease YdiL (CAAX protease family)
MSDVSSEHVEPPRHFPARRPDAAWGPVAALFVTILSFFGAQSLALMTLLAITGIGQLNEEWLTETSGQFYFVLLSDGLILLAVWGFLRHRRAKISQLGLARRPSWLDTGYAILGYLVYFLLFLAIATIAGALTGINLEQEQELGFDAILGSKEKLMALASLVILPPLVEEIVFRGFVFGGLRKKLRFMWATLITSLLFAGPHLLASSEGLLWVAGLDTLALSFVLCYLREKTGALWAPMAVHAIKNTIAFVLLLSGVAAL